MSSEPQITSHIEYTSLAARNPRPASVIYFGRRSVFGQALLGSVNILGGDLWLQKSDHRGSGQIFRQIIVRFWRTVTTPPLAILDGTGQCAVSIHGRRPLTTAST